MTPRPTHHGVVDRIPTGEGWSNALDDFCPGEVLGYQENLLIPLGGRRKALERCEGVEGSQSASSG